MEDRTLRKARFRATRRVVFLLMTLTASLAVSLALAELISYAFITHFQWSKFHSSPVYAVAEQQATDLVRLSALGSSTAAGSPRAGYSLLTFMEFALREQYKVPVTYTVCAKGGWTLEDAMEELWSGAFPKPTVLVVYSGHNEICSRYSPDMKSPPLAGLARLWTGTLLLHTIYNNRADFKQDYHGEFFCQDPIPSYEQEYSLLRYRKLLEALAQHCRHEHITLVLVAPGSNLLFPPTRSVYQGPLDRREEALRLFKQAYYHIHFGDPASPKVMALLNRLAEFCSFAHLHYELGSIHYRNRRWDEALKHLELARDLDGISSRCQGGYRTIVKEIADAYGAVYVDMQEVVIRRLGCPVPDETIFVDDVHLYPVAYHALCLEILDKLRLQGSLALNEVPQPIAREEWPRLGFSPENVAKYSFFLNLQSCGIGGGSGYLCLDQLEFVLGKFHGLQAAAPPPPVESLKIVVQDLTQQIRDERAHNLRWIGSEVPAR